MTYWWVVVIFFPQRQNLFYWESLSVQNLNVGHFWVVISVLLTHVNDEWLRACLQICTLFGGCRWGAQRKIQKEVFMGSGSGGLQEVFGTEDGRQLVNFGSHSSNTQDRALLNKISISFLGEFPLYNVFCESWEESCPWGMQLGLDPSLQDLWAHGSCALGVGGCCN